MIEDWEIWAGSSLALVVPATDPDKSWLTRGMALKYKLEGVTRERAVLIFDRAISRGFLIHRPVQRSTHQGEADGTSHEEADGGDQSEGA